MDSDLEKLQIRLQDYEFLELDLIENLESLVRGKKNKEKSLKSFLSEITRTRKEVKNLENRKVKTDKNSDFTLPVRTYSKNVFR